MRKFFKFLLGAGTVIAVIAGIMYFLKNILMKDYLDDFDDDDFDNDLYEEDSENRDYVTINVPDQEDTDSGVSDSEPENTGEHITSDSEEDE